MNSKSKISIEFRVPVIIEPDGKGYHAYSPSLKGLHIYEDTEKEVKKNAANAVIGFLEVLIEERRPIPEGIIVKKREKRVPIPHQSCTKAEYVVVSVMFQGNWTHL